MRLNAITSTEQKVAKEVLAQLAAETCLRIQELCPLCTTSKMLLRGIRNMETIEFKKTLLFGIGVRRRGQITLGLP